jgi:predicted DNA-binding transcriptional regulator YafY
LKSTPYVSSEALIEYIDKELSRSEDASKVSFSKRTLLRDLKEIRASFGIDIEYCAKYKGYFISSEVGERMSFLRMKEVQEVFYTLQLSEEYLKFIQFENRPSLGTEFIQELVIAIKKAQIIQFDYHKYWENEHSHREVESYYLKEFESRWYLIAKDKKDQIIKSFGLERISNLTILSRTFIYPKHFNIESFYEHCFGITSPNDSEPTDILLSFTPLQGKYIQSFPLHHSQEIVLDTKEEFQVRIKIFISEEFIRKILSMGSEVEVLAPLHLIEKIKAEHREALNQYQ